MYEYVTKTDAAATLATIEEAYAKVPAVEACFGVGLRPGQGVWQAHPRGAAA